MNLVIAEKPSVARSIAAVIGADEKQNGYWQGGGYLVSWCIGHLVSFAEAGQYNEKYCKWRYEDLPILPQPWQFIVPDEKKQQFEIVRALLNRPDVDSVTAATDAGREGELIFRFVYQMAGCTKPVKRLWISSMEDAAIREGFANLRPDSDYDALYQSALCRAKADWLVGINATRLFSVLYHKTLTVGRVQTPALKMLVDRDAKILRFQKEKYYTVGIHSGSLKADSGRIADAEAANLLKEKCTGANAVCVSIRREKKTEQPPKLYDLTTLQREANRLFGFTAKQTLDYAQQLYEKKLLTYPRTDSQYLTEDMGQTAQHLVSDLLGLLPFAQGLDLTPEVGRILNSKKVSDHHAIIPTSEFVKQGFTGLAESECKLMNLVCSKLLCAIAAPHEYETVTAVFSCAGNEFTAKGKTVLVPGWKEIDQRFRSTMKADGEEETKRMLVSIDFENKERISIELPQQVLAGRIVSDGRRIFGSDKDYIYLLNEDKSVKRITRGSDVISVQDEVLYYVFNGKLCQYDLNAQTNSQVQNGPDLLEYDLIDPDSFYTIQNKYFVGCRLSVFVYSDSHSILTYTTIYDLQHGKKYLFMGNLGRIAENFQILNAD